MSARSGFNPHRSALFSDLYELTMMQAYYAEGLPGKAVFEQSDPAGPQAGVPRQ